MSNIPETESLKVVVAESLPVKYSESLYAENLRRLSQFTGPVNAFGKDIDDEIKITRETGNVQGVLKTWAIPVIPFIEANKLGVLGNLWGILREKAKESATFEQTLNELMNAGNNDAIEALQVLENWHDKMLNSPQSLRTSLESARLNSYLIDKRLSKIFSSETLPDDPKQKAVELASRLKFALALQGTFYNTEALVGDAWGFRWNPIHSAQESEKDNRVGGGKLDLYAMVLPSIFKEEIIADTLNWHGLTWQQIREQTQVLLQSQPYSKIILDIARRIEVPVHQVVFALNVLEWIPSRVAGKKDDFTLEKALETLENLPTESAHNNNQEVLRIGQEVNSIMRFLNWFPLEESEENIENSRNWRYAAVCDTSKDLLDHLKLHPELLREDFREIFVNVIIPQLMYLDAESAKGRLLLTLIDEGKFDEEVSESINSYNYENWLGQLLEARQNEALVPLEEEAALPRILIGGKAYGLHEAIQNMPIEINIPKGFILTSEAVEDFLTSDSVLWNLILELDSTTNMQRRYLLAELITNRIRLAEIPSTLSSKIDEKATEMGVEEFAVRSSSWDEDSVDGETAAGIYESFLKVKSSEIPYFIKETIASFFGKKAIAFRNFKNFSDIPHFAVIIQEMVSGVGGVANSYNVHSDGSEGFFLEVGDSADSITSGKTIFEAFGGVDIQTEGSKISAQQYSNIKKLHDEISELTGVGIDLEWVCEEGTEEVTMLQWRPLPKRIDNAESSVIEFTHVLKEDESLDSLISILESVPEGKGRIELMGNRDLDAFKGEFFAIIAVHSNRIAEIVTQENIPLTSHFANICGTLGIKLRKL